MSPKGEIPANIQNEFGQAHSSGDGLTFQAGVNTGTINIDQGHKKIVWPKAVYDATFDAANKEHVSSCLPGTRVQVLSEIRQWVEGDSPKTLYWLNGMAGTGKSTIALTLARDYKRADDVCLGATFFFSRGGGDLASVTKFATTIAIQLAETSSQLRKLIEDVVECNPRLESLNIREQWEKLIIRPLSVLSRKATRQPIRLLIIVDALDECSTNSEDVNVLIKCLEMVTQIEGAHCRVIFTSRPDQQIKVGLANSTSLLRETFVLHNIERSVVDQDLRLYYREQLADIKIGISLDDDLLSEEMIDRLVERSHGLFIHAATACRFVRDGNYLAIERLRKLTISDKGSEEKASDAEQELDKMYTTILEYSFVSVTKRLDTREVKKVQQLFQRIIGTIIVAFDVLSSENLALLLNETTGSVMMVLSALHSVIDVPDDHQKPIQILHPSFRDFILNPKRCVIGSYVIVADKLHEFLATRCFDILMSQLRRNPIHLTRPGSKARDTPAELVDKCIPIPLQYSSRYWIHHILKSGATFKAEMTLLEFLQKKYLFWVECLSWTGQLSQGIEAISKLDIFLRTHSSKKNTSIFASYTKGESKTRSALHSLVQDALRFLLSHGSIIEEAPLQIYTSALLFSPQNCEVRLRNYDEVPKWILNKPSTPKSWSDSQSFGLLLPHSSMVDSVAFSPDSKLIATACEDLLVHVLDAVTGTEKLMLKGLRAPRRSHLDRASIAFSPDGECVASLANTTVLIWKIGESSEGMILPDVTIHFHDPTGTSHSKLHGNSVCKFSPNGNLLAGSSFSRDIWVWELNFTRDVKFHFRASRCVKELFFSLDGHLLISVSESEENGSSHELVNIWDMQTGLKLGSEAKIPEKGPLAFLSGTRYVGVSDSTPTSAARLVIRDARTGTEYKSFALPHYVPQKAMFKPHDDEPLLVSILGNRVLLWTPDNCKEPWVLEIRGSLIRDAFISPNGEFVAVLPSGSRFVKIFNIQGADRVSSPWGHFYNKYIVLAKVALWPLFYEQFFDSEPVFLESQDGCLLAAGRQKMSTIIWDTKTGNEKFRFPGGAGSLSFSPDGKICAVEGCMTFGGLKPHIELRSMVNGEVTDILQGFKEGINAFDWDGPLSFSPGGDKIVLGCSHYPGEHLIWNIDEPHEPDKIPFFKVLVSSGKDISLSPDALLFVAWKKGTDGVELRYLSDNRLLFERAIQCVQDIQFMPGSRHILIVAQRSKDGEKRTIGYIWNIMQDKLDQLTPPYDTLITGLCFSADGRIVAVAAARTIDLYDIHSSTSFCRIHLDVEPRVVRFAPSGTHLITDRGAVLLPGSPPPQSPQLFATKTWVQEDGEDILAIPRAYRNSFVGINDHTVAFCDREHGPLFLRLDEGVKTMTA